MGIIQSLIKAIVYPYRPAEEKPDREPTIWKVKQPPKVEAMQYDGTLHMAARIGAWSFSHDNPAEYTCGQEECTGVESDHVFTVHTIDGERVVNPGDWVIRDHMGAFIHYTDHHFTETYERA